MNGTIYYGILEAAAGIATLLLILFAIVLVAVSWAKWHMKHKTSTEMKTIKIHPIRSCFDGLINSFPTRTLINLVEPTVDMIHIEDIACALSNICRFGGHTNRFYSVAQHSLLVAGLAPNHLKKEALLHDAAEAYVGDVVKPWKIILGDAYAVTEWKFTMVIMEKFGLKFDNMRAVKVYDLMALDMEHQFLQEKDPSVIAEHALNIELFDPFDPNPSYERFIMAYSQYFNVPMDNISASYVPQMTV